MKIKELLKEKNEIKAVTEMYLKRARQLDYALDKFIEKKKIFKPIECLKKYKGEDVQEITLISESGKTYDYYCGEITEIDENGNFYFSDYEQGIVECQSDGHYYQHYHFSQTDLGKIIGVRNLVLCDNRMIKETSIEELLKKYGDDEIIIKLVEEGEESAKKISDIYE